MAPAKLSGIYPQKRALARRGQPVLVLPLCGFSPEAPGGAGGGNLLLAGSTNLVERVRIYGKRLIPGGKYDQENIKLVFDTVSYSDISAYIGNGDRRDFD